ncbi:hypothetical protein BGC07_05730 [Piscirickettsia litoralis]|uniref:Uncharacterized protein n=1 Tax=Piscirickettsia litoralis TaxID=1891921 RepID=A0ABX3A4D3_9GAMM|nr:hypothetical protein BGC07_05730 [Piscirickettsia litoralis]
MDKYEVNPIARSIVYQTKKIDIDGLCDITRLINKKIVINYFFIPSLVYLILFMMLIVKNLFLSIIILFILLQI